MAELYRIFAYDLNTNTLLCEIPYTGLSFDSRLGDAGAISFDIPLGSMTVRNLVGNLLAYDGEPVALYVDRGGQIVWAGLAWTTAFNKLSRVMSFGGKEFLSYFDQRILVKSYTNVEYPSGIDPAALIAAVLVDAQNTVLAGAGSSIGVSVLGGTSTLPVQIPGYPLNQYSMVTDVVNDMTAISVPGFGGLDIIQNSFWLNGSPTTNLQVCYPRAGRVAGSTGLIFDMNSAIDYDWPTDATAAGNTLVATGAGTGDALPVATVNAPGVPVGGLGQAPRLDKVVNFPQAQSQQQISAAAAGSVNTYGRPLVTPKITIPTGGGQPLGSWIMGDDARLYNSGDERFPQGIDQSWRVVQQSVTVPDEGLATVAVTFNLPPAY